MKKIIIILTFLLVPSLCNAATSGGTILADPATSSKVAVTISTAASEVDSVMVCYFTPASSTDTVAVAYIDSALASYIISGLSPEQQVVVFLRAVSGTGLAISNKDTSYAYRPQLMENNNDLKVEVYNRYALPVTSWPVTGTYLDESNIFTLDGVGDSEYSHYFYVNKLTGIKVLAIDDSVAVTVYVRQVYPHFANDISYTAYKDTAVWIFSVKDSLQAGIAGAVLNNWNAKDKSLALSVGQIYQIYATSYTGHGHNKRFRVLITSWEL